LASFWVHAHLLAACTTPAAGAFRRCFTCSYAVLPPSTASAVGAGQLRGTFSYASVHSCLAPVPRAAFKHWHCLRAYPCRYRVLFCACIHCLFACARYAAAGAGFSTCASSAILRLPAHSPLPAGIGVYHVPYLPPRHALDADTQTCYRDGLPCPAHF